MKKTIICAAAVCITAAAAGAFLYLSAPRGGNVTQDDIAASFGTVSDAISTQNTGGMKTYSNGIASFTYDSASLCFEEMPSDNEDGYPFTSFLPLNSTAALPRVDIVPLVGSVFSGWSEEEWKNLARSLILAYYQPSEYEQVAINFGTPVMKSDGNEIKMFIAFDTALDGSATPNMHGVLRLVSDGGKGVVTAALSETGQYVPASMESLYMSVDLT